MITGRVAKLETLGTLDGPGIRTVVFLQGCLLRCAYCHNPALLSTQGGVEYTAKGLFETVKRYKPYFDEFGGVTVSGGEPLMQTEFLTEFFALCKQDKIHTCLDTSGVGFGNFEQLLKVTDLVLLDIKHTSKEGFKELTLVDKERTLEFHNELIKQNTPIWIRQVIVPDVTDSQEYMDSLLIEIQKFNNIEKIEFLPFHTMAANLYKDLNIPYRYEGKPAMNVKVAMQLQEDFIKKYESLKKNNI